MEDFRIVLIVALMAILAVRFYKRYYGKPKDEQKERKESSVKDDYEPYSGK